MNLSIIIATILIEVSIVLYDSITNKTIYNKRR